MTNLNCYYFKKNICSYGKKYVRIILDLFIRGEIFMEELKEQLQLIVEKISKLNENERIYIRGWLDAKIEKEEVS